MKLGQIDKNIALAAEEAQRLVDDEFARCDGHPPQGSPLDQCGLRNGKGIILDLLSHGEAGLALEHVIYMIEETGIGISEDAKEYIRNAADHLGMQVSVQ